MISGVNMTMAMATTRPQDDNVDPSSFLGVLRRETGSDGFNLPTEAQWEFFCRAGSSGDFYGTPDRYSGILCKQRR